MKFLHMQRPVCTPAQRFDNQVKNAVAEMIIISGIAVDDISDQVYGEMEHLIKQEFLRATKPVGGIQ